MRSPVTTKLPGFPSVIGRRYWSKADTHWQNFGHLATPNDMHAIAGKVRLYTLQACALWHLKESNKHD